MGLGWALRFLHPGQRFSLQSGPECCQATPAPTPASKRWRMMPATPAHMLIMELGRDQITCMFCVTCGSSLAVRATRSPELGSCLCYVEFEVSGWYSSTALDSTTKPAASTNIVIKIVLCTRIRHAHWASFEGWLVPL